LGLAQGFRAHSQQEYRTSGYQAIQHSFLKQGESEQIWCKLLTVLPEPKQHGLDSIGDNLKILLEKNSGETNLKGALCLNSETFMIPNLILIHILPNIDSYLYLRCN
jgi:hypothetical protein